MTNHPSTNSGLGHRQWLAVLLLVAVVPFFTACPPDRADPVEPVDDPPITSVSALLAMTEAEADEGREVRLLNVRVVEVLGDTAFYVVDDLMGPAPPPPATDPAFPDDDDPDMQDDPAMDDPAMQDDAAMQDPAMQDDPMMRDDMGMQEERALVKWSGDMLGDLGAGDDFHDVVRVGANVDVFGQTRTRDHMTTRTAPAPAQDDPAVTDDPAMPQTTPPGPRTQDRVYVDADNVEPHDPARAMDDRTAPGGTGTTGQPGRIDSPDAY